MDILHFEAEALTSRLDNSRVHACDACSANSVVGGIGYSSSLTIRDLTVEKPRQYRLTIYYVHGDPGPRTASVQINGASTFVVSFPPRDWSSLAAAYVDVNLLAGPNTVKIFNPSGWAPDIDRITITAYEAEHGALGGASTFACAGCDGGYKVGMVGYGNRPVIPVTMSTPGTYLVIVRYTSGENRAFDVKMVQGLEEGLDYSLNRGLGLQTFHLDAPATGGWTTPGIVSFKAQFEPRWPLEYNQYLNTSWTYYLEFSNATAWAPDLDGISLMRVPDPAQLGHCDTGTTTAFDPQLGNISFNAISCNPLVKPDDMGALISRTDAIKDNNQHTGPEAEDWFMLNTQYMAWIDVTEGPGILRGLWQMDAENVDSDYFNSKTEPTIATDAMKSLVKISRGFSSAHDVSEGSLVPYGYLGLHVEIWRTRRPEGHPPGQYCDGCFWTYRNKLRHQPGRSDPIAASYESGHQADLRYATHLYTQVTNYPEYVTVNPGPLDLPEQVETLAGRPPSPVPGIDIEAGPQETSHLVWTVHYRMTQATFEISTRIDVTAPVNIKGPAGGLLLLVNPACKQARVGGPIPPYNNAFNACSQDAISARSLRVATVPSLGSPNTHVHSNATADMLGRRVDFFAEPSFGDDEDRFVVQWGPEPAPYTLRSSAGSAGDVGRMSVASKATGVTTSLPAPVAGFSYHYNSRPIDLGRQRNTPRPPESPEFVDGKTGLSGYASLDVTLNPPNGRIDPDGSPAPTVELSNGNRNGIPCPTEDGPAPTLPPPSTPLPSTYLAQQGCSIWLIPAPAGDTRANYLQFTAVIAHCGELALSKLGGSLEPDCASIPNPP